MKLNWNALLYSLSAAGGVACTAALAEARPKVVILTGLVSFFTTFKAYLNPPDKEEKAGG
jgi:hypothetical protein